MSDEFDWASEDWDSTTVWAIPDAQSSYLFYAYPQIDRLLRIHQTLGGARRRRGYNLEVINKSAIVMMCAFWEAFVEDLASDALRHLAGHAKTAEDLPMSLRKNILKELTAAKHELAMWDIADQKWRDLLRARADKIVAIGDRTLSSPTSLKVNEFFEQQSGMTHVCDAWHWRGTSSQMAQNKLDAFVELRNLIAHRGGPRDEAVLKRHANNALRLIDHLVASSIRTVDKQLTATTDFALVRQYKLSDYVAEDEP